MVGLTDQLELSFSAPVEPVPEGWTNRVGAWSRFTGVRVLLVYEYPPGSWRLDALGPRAEDGSERIERCPTVFASAAEACREAATWR